MNTCREQQNIERWFDGESSDDAAARVHLETCASCRDYLGDLKRLRRTIKMQRESVEIADAQMPAFLRELERRVQQPRSHGMRWIALLSGTAAAVIMAVSLITVFAPGQTPIEATVIENATSEIDGATTESHVDKDGTATVWVNLPEGDLW